MFRACLTRVVIAVLSAVALSATAVVARSVRIDELTAFEASYQIVPGAVVQMVDGRPFGFFSGRRRATIDSGRRRTRT